jgi:hypothetical protein
MNYSTIMAYNAMEFQEQRCITKRDTAGRVSIKSEQDQRLFVA